MENLFSELNAELFAQSIDPRTQESREWFAQKVREINPNSVQRRQLMQAEELELTRRTLYGRMYMFFYDPKGKTKLPYYDRFPVVIVTEKTNNGFKGINLHYLPIDLRSILMGNLLDHLNNNKGDETTRFKIDYDKLKGNSRFRYFKPCYKRYLTANIKGNIARVYPNEWEIASFLPTAQFKKKRQASVHKESRKIIRDQTR